ncbi:MAG: hypothetical protein DI539_09515 [Flavobacterium psychrophilum]|nr:MAG: hypothetical protein DI539_09515 [Flavobacterium psychrophilum]
MTRKKEIPLIVIHVGARIASIIKAKDLRYTNVASDAGLDEQALRRYAKGKLIMGIDKLYAISYALGVEVGDLFKSE